VGGREVVDDDLLGRHRTILRKDETRIRGELSQVRKYWRLAGGGRGFVQLCAEVG
jgi:hypothetical protein